MREEKKYKKITRGREESGKKMKEKRRDLKKKRRDRKRSADERLKGKTVRLEEKRNEEVTKKEGMKRMNEETLREGRDN